MDDTPVQSLRRAGADLPYQMGGLYSRRLDIHDKWGGQRQGGISTPKDGPFVFIFTGEAGKAHGYTDSWDDDGILHYYGEGQQGDMTMRGGNKAIAQHIQSGKRLLVFKSLGHGKPYRFDGEFVCLSSYAKPDTPATIGANRTAIVFRLQPVDGASSHGNSIESPSDVEMRLGSTVAMRLGAVRTKQQLFRRRLIDIEKSCRITGVMDLRFLRASHIKPWSGSSAAERTDGNNGLLLTPTADHLFDKGWISFEAQGQLLVSNEIPSNVLEKIGLKLKKGSRVGAFNEMQGRFLEFHRNKIFEHAYRGVRDPLEELVEVLGS